MGVFFLVLFLLYRPIFTSNLLVKIENRSGIRTSLAGLLNQINGSLDFIPKLLRKTLLDLVSPDCPGI